MTKICEHELKKGVEYDLYGRLDMTIAWSEKLKRFVIKKISDDEVVYAYERLESAVHAANELEGEPNTEVGCGTFCDYWRHEPRTERSRGVKK